MMDDVFFNSLTDGDFSLGRYATQSLLDGDFWTRWEDEWYLVHRGQNDEWNYRNAWAAYDDGDASVNVNYQDLTAVFGDTDCVLLLHHDGVDGSATIVDSSLYAGTHTITAQGSYVLDDTQFRFGQTSGRAIGVTNGYLLINDNDDWYFGTGEFTIEMFIRFDTLPLGAIALWMQDAGAVEINLFIGGNEKLYFDANDGVNSVSLVSAAVLALDVDTWYHLAVTRDSSDDWHLYWNGTRKDTANNVMAAPNVADNVDVFGGLSIRGWVDDIRVLKGRAEYTGATYAVPTHAFGNNYKNYWQFRHVAVGKCGRVSDPAPITRIIVDSSGAMVGPLGNPPSGLLGRAIAGGKVELVWQYLGATNQEIPPTGFKIYYDVAGTWTLLDTEPYLRARNFVWQSAALTDGQWYDFIVRTYVTSNGGDYEDDNEMRVSVQADSTGPPVIDEIEVEVEA